MGDSVVLYAWMPWLTILLTMLVAGAARAGGPRYVTGPPFFTGPAGVPIGWRQANLAYFTDPGDLSASVNHAAADVLVANAMSVWNVPVARITVSQGGVLAEHVNGTNVYLSGAGLSWPSDVESANAAAIAVAVIYDRDGSVTDTLLGAGASDPAGCEENEVTHTVDAFDPAGYILHAIVILNGRCTGPKPEQQLQMQYKLERAFGRVLGLAWSQTNDNVFTGSPQPTYEQANHWPVMHPLEILCGAYSYQCLPNAFTLRPDDVAGLVSVYPIVNGIMPPAGKVGSLAAATSAAGYSLFPDGEGMAGVNVLLMREPSFTVSKEGWYEVSAVTGSRFRRSGASPFIAPGTDAQASMGAIAPNQRGFVDLAYADLITPGFSQNEVTSTEAINPLYIGLHSVGVYAAGIVAPAGSPQAPLTWLQVAAGVNLPLLFLFPDAPVACGDGADGTLTQPMEAPASGWWNGLICGYGHAAYAALQVKAQRSLTIEVTALDESGLPTMKKAMPVIGLFAASDAEGSLPSVGVQPTAFNTMEEATTALTVVITGGQAGQVRVGVADERGEGRPDFEDQTRIFYADSVMPIRVQAAGGTTLTISGMGFRAGNEVLVSGFAATVLKSTATEILVVVPPLSLVGAVAGTPVDVEVRDQGTGATATMMGALTYSDGLQLPNAMLLISAETAPAPAGSTTASQFAVRVVKSDGVTPVAGDVVVFSSSRNAVRYAACGAATCNVLTDADGVAMTTLTPLSAGVIELQATDGLLSLSASFLATPQVTALKVVQAPSGNATVGRPTANGFGVTVIGANGAALSGQQVTFAVAQGSVGNVTFGACNASPCTLATNTWGGAGVSITPIAPGLITLVASDGAVEVQTTFTAVEVANVLTLIAVPQATAYVGETVGALIGRLTLGDGVTAIPNVSLILSAPAGAVFTSCALSVCALRTDNSGRAGSALVAKAAGTYTLTVGYGNLSQSTQLTVSERRATLKLISAPTGDVPVGTMAAQPLTAQLLDRFGSPWALQEITLGGPLGSVSMSCEPGTGSCVALTDNHGMVSSRVTPLRAGVITLEAVFQNLVEQASFNSVGTSETFRLVTPLPPSVNIGATISFTLQAIGPDRSTPVVNHRAVFTTTSGVLAYAHCGFGSCQANTNTKGEITINGTGWVAGPVKISVVLDGLVVLLSFDVVPVNQSMKRVSAPAGVHKAGSVVQPAFTVQMVGPDGKTGVSGQNVTFSAPNQASSAQVKIAACTMPCMVRTDAAGLASSGAITVSGAGTLSLLANDNGSSERADFSVVSAKLSWQPPRIFLPRIRAAANAPLISSGPQARE